MPVRHRARLSVGLMLVASGVLMGASPAWAQVPDPAPDSSLPGGTLITQLLGWLKYASTAGRKWVLGGVGAAMLAGLAHTIAMTVYNAT